MPDYLPIADSEVQPEAPVTSSLGVRFRDNPIAISQGATGAPRIKTVALEPPTAGGLIIARMLLDPTDTSFTTTGENVYIDPGLLAVRDTARNISVLALVPGTIRVTYDHRSTTLNNSESRVLRNGVVQATFLKSAAQTTFETRTVEVNVDVGDVVTMQQRRVETTNSQWRNMFIRSALRNMAVAVL